MSIVPSPTLWLLATVGALGAFDTLYYHEWRARLPAHRALAASELALHAARDGLYAVVFATLPWLAWEGWWAGVLLVLLTGEIGLTLADFVVEVGARRTLGGVDAGERVTHAVMGILYGAMIATLLPVLAVWWSRSTALASAPPPIPAALRPPAHRMPAPEPSQARYAD